MGAPPLFKWLCERFPEVVKSIGDSKTDHLYVDANFIIHGCCKSVVDPARIYAAVCDYLRDLVEAIQPTKTLYIAFDGVAPRAKAATQRARRFRSVKSPTGFDFNCISPGTRFMSDLASYVWTYLALNQSSAWSHLTIVLSDSNHPGEGEQKIADYIRTAKTKPDFSPGEHHLICGNDTDLLFVGLCTREPNTKILGAFRGSPFLFELPHTCLHLDTLRRKMASDFLVSKTRDLGDVDRIANDLILLCALGGTDYLPGVYTAFIGQMMESYKFFLRSATDPYLTTRDGLIRFKLLSRFLDSVNNSFMEPLSKGTAAARTEFYETAFALQPCADDDSDFESIVDETAGHFCIRYIQGLEWSVQYYVGGPPSWDWFYPARYAPLITDVQVLVSSFTPTKFESANPLSPFEQLVSILPASSADLLPDPLQALLTDSQMSPIGDFFPIKFEEVVVPGV